MISCLILEFLFCFTLNIFGSLALTSNVHVPDNSISRSHYTWYILDSDHQFKSIYASRVNKTLNGITTSGIHYTFNGTVWANSNLSAVGVNESLKLGNADLGHTVLISDSGKAYLVSPVSNRYEMVAQDIQNTSFKIVANISWGGINTSCGLLVAKIGTGITLSHSFVSKIEVNATDLSCSNWTKTCWYLETPNVLKFYMWSTSLIVATTVQTLYIAEDAFSSVTVHKNEIWLITTDGKRAWRRLGVTRQTPFGNRWMILPIYLPYPVASISVGLIGIYVVMQGGLVARFQGFEYPKVQRSYKFFDIDTYDGKSVLALSETGTKIQSSASDAVKTSYGIAMVLLNKNLDIWENVSGIESAHLKSINVGENVIYAIKSGKRHDIHEVIDHSLSTYSNVKATSIGIGAAGVFYTVNNDSATANILCQQSYGPTTITTNYSPFESIACGKFQCWGIYKNGTSALIKVDQSTPCPNTFLPDALTMFIDDILIDRVDVDKSGEAWAIEKRTQEVFFQVVASTNQLDGLAWANIPGVTLKDIAVGNTTVYGLDSNGQLIFFELKDGNWTTWSQWTRCDADCLGGQQSRERHCHHPAPRYGGKNCSGESNQSMPCNQQNCSDSCIKAVDENSKLRCCAAPDVIGTPTAEQIMLRCLPTAIGSYSCILNGTTTTKGTCLPVATYWSQWTSWSQCAGEYAIDNQTRNRTCFDPLPLTSTGCQGDAQQSKPCNISCTVIFERNISKSWEDGTKGLTCGSYSFFGGSTVQYTMLHFSNATIPRNSHILNASIQLTAKYSASSPLIAKVRAALNRDITQADFETCNFNSFVYTSVSKTWMPGAWIAEERGEAERITDLAPVIQEAISAPDWYGNGSIVIAFTDFISTTYRGAYYFEADASKVATLRVEYRACPSPKPLPPWDWTAWSAWTNCSHECFAGKRNRQRSCQSSNGNLTGNPEQCGNSSMQEMLCNTHSCMDLSNCTKAAYINGSMSCCMLNMALENGTVYEKCIPASNQTYKCPLDRYGLSFGDCVTINGNFSDWSPWSNCSHSCFTGYSYRNRSCNNPLPKYGGLPCNGSDVAKRTCNTQPCNDPSTCTKARNSNGSVSCCMLGIPFQNGTIYNDCLTSSRQTYTCPLDRFGLSFGECVAINGNFSDWSPWSNCSHSCFTGHSNRNRSCNNPLPKYGGLPCSGSDVEQRTCNTHPCNGSTCTNARNSNGSLSCCMLGIPLENGTVYHDCMQNSGLTFVCPLDRFGTSFGECVAVNGDFSDWSNWSNCSHKCFTGNQRRNRTCENPTPKYGGLPCDGGYVDQRQCNRHSCYDSSNCTLAFASTAVLSCCMLDMPLFNGHVYNDCIPVSPSTYGCPLDRFNTTFGICAKIHGKYSMWSKWSDCNQSCLKTRTRTCNKPTPKYGGNYCDGANNETIACSSSTCFSTPNCTRAVDPSGNYKCCTDECVFVQYIGFQCTVGPEEKTGICLPVHGNWTAWSQWSECENKTSCKKQVRFRERNCTNPISLYDGMECQGAKNQTEPCIYCASDETWSSWELLEPCNATCGPGYQKWTRHCQDIQGMLLPLSKCIGTHTKTNSCQVAVCPTSNTKNLTTTAESTSYMGYGEWSVWGVCSKTCGGGTRMRYRDCLNTSLGDRHIGVSSVCGNQPCEVVSWWTTWSSWSPCDLSCGGGLKTSYRSCVNEEASSQEAVCDGDALRQEECNLQICPVDGKWSRWSDWSLCDKPCNYGVRKRVRFCDSPVSQYGGKECNGSSELAMSCNPHSCKSVSLNVTVRFTEETFTNDLLNRSSMAFEKLKEKIRDNVMAIYGNNSHVINLHIHYFSPGSVKASFTLTFKEISSTEVVLLSSYLEEKKFLWKMPLAEKSIKTSEVPSYPTSVSPVETGSTSIKLRWNSLSLTSLYNLTGYIVMFRKTIDFDEASWTKIPTLPNQTSVNITHLEPYVLYTFRVMAMLSNSLGIPSDFIDIYTSQGAPTKPPSNFSCQAISSSVIFCEWGNIPHHSVKGELIEYRIKYRIYDLRRSLNSSTSRAWHNETVDGAKRSVIIDGLIAFTRYELEIHGVTPAGHGLGEWSQVITDEDVPSKAPTNITSLSYMSDKFIDISWNSIPKDYWNGKPAGIILSYTITRRGRTDSTSSTEKKILLQTDSRRYRIRDLQVNWAVSFRIAGSTTAGEGIASRALTTETCRCSKILYSAWYEKKPYVFSNPSSQVVGIFSELLQNIVTSVCGTCASYGASKLYFDRTPSGHSPRRLTKDDLIAKLSHDVHFHFPVFAGKTQMLYEGTYQYVNILDRVSSVFVVVDKARASKTRLMLNAVSLSYPIVAVIFLLVVFSGMVIWFVDQYKNPDELRKGRFASGVCNGAWWAFITMTTVGYGDIAPRGFFGRVTTVIWIIVGIVITGIFISTLSTALTVITLDSEPKLYGAKVAAVYNSSEYWLGVRRWAIMNSTGKNYRTTKEALEALVSRNVSGVLLEANEASNLQEYFSDNKLRICKEIDSSNGIGILLSGEMVGLHSDIRSFVYENPELIQRLVQNGTSSLKLPSLSNDQDEATGFFDQDSDELKNALFYCLLTLGVMVFLGCCSSFVRWLSKVLNRKVHPVSSKEQKALDEYNERSEELMKMVDCFVKDSEKRITAMYEEHGKQRFELLLKHCETTPFGPPAWVKHKTLDSQHIMSNLTKDEILFDSLITKPHRKIVPPKRPEVYEQKPEPKWEFLDLENDL